MIVKLLTEHHLEFLSLTGGCRGSSESTLVKMSNCWKSHAMAQIYLDWFLVDNFSLMPLLFAKEQIEVELRTNLFSVVTF